MIFLLVGLILDVGNGMMVDSPIILDTISIKIVREEPMPYINHILARPGDPSNVAKLLHARGGIYTQQSQGGGGSPIIRGFEANRILLQAEGTPLNMTIFRGGHLQNSILWSPCFLYEMEVFEGGSVYNEALGGTINFKLKKPSDKYVEIANHFESATKNWSSCANVSWDSTLVGISYATYGDIKSGKVLPKGGEKWLRNRYVVSKDRDYVITNMNPFVQRPSGYKHLATFFRKQFHKNDLWVYATATSNIPRYDRLTLEENGKPKYSEWYYGPHLWGIVKNTYSMGRRTDIEGMAFFYRESRHRRKFNDPWRWNQIESVVGVHANINRKVLRHGTLKFSNRFEHVFSKSYKENIFTKMRDNAPTRYPQRGTNVLYSHISFDQKSDLSRNVKTYINIVVGGSIVDAKMGESKVFYPFLPDKVFRTFFSWGGFIGFMYEESDFEAGLTVRRAFKFPNIDDLAKVFDSKPGVVFVPSYKLGPEVVYSWEIPIIVKPENFYVKFTPVYQVLRNRITAVASNDSILYEGESSQVYYITNSQRGEAIGFTASMKALLWGKVDISASGRFLQGTLVLADGSVVPLSHVPPATMLTTVSFPVKGKVSMNLEWYWQDTKPKDLYNPGSEDNLQYALDYGLPVVNIFNVGLIISFSAKVFIYLGVDNIFDIHWRSFASGISNPGRNFIFELKIKI